MFNDHPKKNNGNLIYEGCGIEVRTNPEIKDQYNLVIHGKYFSISPEDLKKYGENMPVLPMGNLEHAMQIWNPQLLMAAKEAEISPEGLVLILARARISEIKNEEHGCHGCSSCHCKKKDKE